MFVAQYEDGCLAGIDQASGGYPWKAYIPGTRDHLCGVKFWTSRIEAEDYCKTSPELTVKEFRFQVV